MKENEYFRIYPRGRKLESGKVNHRMTQFGVISYHCPFTVKDSVF